MTTTARLRHAPRPRRARGLPVLAVTGGVIAAGCRAGPDVAVVGSYFPSWMVALVVGVLGTAMFWQLFVRVGIDAYLAPRALVYAGLVVLITIVVWLGVFRG